MNCEITESIRRLCRACMCAVWETAIPNDLRKNCINEVPAGADEQKTTMELLQLVQPQIKVDINDELPKLMCSDCIKKLQLTYKFLEKYRAVDAKLRQMLENAVIIRNSFSHLKSVDEALQLMQEKDNLYNIRSNDYLDDNYLDNDGIMDTTTLNELDEKLALQETNLDIAIENMYIDEFADEIENLYEHISYNYPELEKFDDSVKELEFNDNPYSGESDDDDDDGVVDDDDHHLSENEAFTNTQQEVAGILREVQENHIPSERTDDGMSNPIDLKTCPTLDQDSTINSKYEFDKEAFSHLFPEKSITDTSLDHDNTKNSKQKVYEIKTRSKKIVEKRNAELEIINEPTLEHENSESLKRISRKCNEDMSEGEKKYVNKTPSKKSPKKFELNTNGQPDTSHCDTTKFPDSYKNNDIHMSSDSEDGGISCQEYENEDSLKLSLEKSNTYIADTDSTNISEEENGISTTCKDCGASFKNNSMWQKHIKIHLIKKERAIKNGNTKTKKNIKDQGNTQQSTVSKNRKDDEEIQTPLQNDNESISPEKSGTDFEHTTSRSLNPDTSTNSEINFARKRRVAIENEDGSFSCQECNEVFENRKMWRKHIKKHSTFKCEHCGKGETPYQCVECGVCFKASSSLRSHMTYHRGIKNKQCPKCPKKFVSASSLNIHQRMVHSNDKPFVCDICGKSFHMASGLKFHNKVYHNNVRNFKCDFCDKRFILAERQRRHMRTHTGEKPYRCEYCERAYAQSNDLIKHLRDHLGENVYRCELCPQKFRLARDLRAHFATHINDDEETRKRNLEARNEDEKKLLIKLGVKQLHKQIKMT